MIVIDHSADTVPIIQASGELPVNLDDDKQEITLSAELPAIVKKEGNTLDVPN